MSRNAVIGITVVVLVLLLGWYYLKSQKAGVGYTPQATPTTTQPEESPATPSSQAGVAEENVVNIQPSGFLPKDITIKSGQSVTWVNQDTVDHQVNSAVHPTHQVYPPLNTVGLLKSGEKKSLIFPDAGTYKYHDHLNPSLTGSVTVE